MKLSRVRFKNFCDHFIFKRFSISSVVSKYFFRTVPVSISDLRNFQKSTSALEELPNFKIHPVLRKLASLPNNDLSIFFNNLVWLYLVSEVFFIGFLQVIRLANFQISHNGIYYIEHSYSSNKIIFFPLRIIKKDREQYIHIHVY